MSDGRSTDDELWQMGRDLARSNGGTMSKTKLRKAARGMPCQVRLPGCNGGGDTTVLAHYRLAGYCGTGLKPDDDVFGAWACSNCHDLIDGRMRCAMTHAELRLAHAEGILRTQMARKA